MSSLGRILRRFLGAMMRKGRSEDGSTAIEFVIALPLLFAIFMMSMEAGVTLMRKVMLDRALDITIRDLRLGALDNATHDQVRDAVCENAFLLPGCRANLTLELTAVTLTTWTAPQVDVQCVDRATEITPVNAFTQAGQTRPTLVRACMVIDLIFPTSGLGLGLPTDELGGFRLVATSVFINEPAV